MQSKNCQNVSRSGAAAAAQDIDCLAVDMQQIVSARWHFYNASGIPC
jgi:hypothetical protein